jgi:hypothetical protein
MDYDTKFIGISFEGYKDLKQQEHQFQLDLEKAKAANPCTK